MRSSRFLFSAVLLLGLCPVPAMYAHHGNVTYDMKHTVVLTGTVTQLELANPHSTIALDVRDENGISHWTVEFGVLRELKDQGWTETTLKPGDEIKIAVHARKDGDHSSILAKGVITYADGRPLPLNPLPGQHRIMHW